MEQLLRSLDARGRHWPTRCTSRAACRRPPTTKELGDRRRAAGRPAAGRGGARAGLRRRRCRRLRRADAGGAACARSRPTTPTDLLLRLDSRYEHLLLDEFQDTSDVQYELLASLTAGWTDGDGRTLFAVGDPMQSIYRFRDAEVRLFLDAQARRRIGNVTVRVVDLTRNFRFAGRGGASGSTTVFPAVLAPRAIHGAGRSSFAPAVATRAAVRDARPTIDLRATTPAAEAERVVQRVAAALAAGATDIAILVRMRSALDLILPALRAARHSLCGASSSTRWATRQSMLDLTSLAHALLQPADCLASLAVLRAPWCGLRACRSRWPWRRTRSHGLHVTSCVRHHEIAGDQRRRPCSTSIALPRRCCRRLPSADAVPFSECVRGAWLALGGPATVDEAIDLDARVSGFWHLLAEHETGGDIRDWNQLLDALATMYPTPATGSAARVQVMTLHNAKGLEFDTVILPGLARESHSATTTTSLRWRTRPARSAAGAHQGERRRRKIRSTPTWTCWRRRKPITSSAACSTSARRARDAAAPDRDRRDRRRDSAGEAEWKPPRTDAALAKLWPALAASLPPQPTGCARSGVRMRRHYAPPRLLRFPAGFALPALAATYRSASAPCWRACRADRPIRMGARHRRCRSAPSRIGCWRNSRAKASRSGMTSAWRHWIRVSCMELRKRRRATMQQLAQAAADVDRALRNVLADPRGRWLFDPAHAEAASEWTLAGIDDGAIVHVSLDRTFVADGVRWIVDFKTGRHEGGDTTAFLAREEERYRAQLERYARIVRALDPRPIRLALYYPLVDAGWREWAFRAGMIEILI